MGQHFSIPIIMSKKLGRPKLPKGESKSTQIGVRLNATQGNAIGSKAVAAGLSKGEWIRDAAVEKTCDVEFWVTSKWKEDDLDKATLEFRLPISTGGFSPPTKGQFVKVKPNLKGELSLTVSYLIFSSADVCVENRFPVPQPWADRIEYHPDQSVARFQMMLE